MKAARLIAASAHHRLASGRWLRASPALPALLADSVLAHAAPVKYPRLVECAAPMTACDDPEFHYRFGIGLFIDGVKTAAARRVARADTRSG